MIVYVFPLASSGGKAWRIFQYLVELSLLVGLFRLIFRPRGPGLEFKTEYISLSIVSVLILLGVFVLPGHSYGLGVTRIFHITLLFLTPMFLLGGEVIVYGVAKLARLFPRGFVSLRLSFKNSAPLRFTVLLILIPYFVFNSGAVFEISRSKTVHFIDIPYSISLSSYRVDLTTVFSRQDIAAADWLLKIGNQDYPICADHHIGWFCGQLGLPEISNRMTRYNFGRRFFLPLPVVVGQSVEQSRPK